MGRLTWKNPDGTWGLNNMDIREVPSELYGAVCKLKDYEETGLTPEQIDEIDVLYADKCREVAKLKKELEAERYDNRWILCEDGKNMPEEHDSIFAKFKGTDKWNRSMFEKLSDDVNITVEFEDGTRKTWTSYTVDGRWNTDRGLKFKVIAWMPLPKPYKECSTAVNTTENEGEESCAEDARADEKKVEE